MVPLNPEKVLERIPSAVETQQAARHLDAALLQRLEVRRFGDSTPKKPRGKKVPEGQSYTHVDEEDSEEEEEDETEEEEKEDDDVDVDALLGGSRDAPEDSDREEELPDLTDSPMPGTYVAAVYEGQWFLAEVCRDQDNVKRGYTRLAYMAIKGKNAFAQPSRADLHVTLDEDILLKNIIPEPVNSRGCLGLNKKDLSNVLTLMVVVLLTSQNCFYWLFIQKRSIITFLNLFKLSNRTIFN